MQLRRDKRRDYPYINRLISVEEQIEGGVREDEVAREWNIRLTSLQADRWAFQLIKDAVERSTSEGGHRLSLLQFNDQQESFRELYRHYSRLAETDPDGAEQLKETRLAAILLGLPKTSLRFMEGNFYSNYLSDRLPPSLKPSVDIASSGVSIPGLPKSLTIDDDSTATRSARSLTDTLLRARATSLAGGDGAGRSEGTLSDANEVFRTAARRAGNDNSLKKKKSAAPEQVAEAADCLVQGSREFAKARAERTLDLDSFDEAVLLLRESLEALAKQAARTAGDSPGEGVQWLIDLARSR